MYRNLNSCPEIEELKKAILRDLPEDAINSNSNSKDKLSLIHKKEKEHRDKAEKYGVEIEKLNAKVQAAELQTKKAVDAIQSDLQSRNLKLIQQLDRLTILIKFRMQTSF